MGRRMRRRNCRRNCKRQRRRRRRRKREKERKIKRGVFHCMNDMRRVKMWQHMDIHVCCQMECPIKRLHCTSVALTIPELQIPLWTVVVS